MDMLTGMSVWFHLPKTLTSCKKTLAHVVGSLSLLKLLSILKNNIKYIVEGIVFLVLHVVAVNGAQHHCY